MTGEESLLFAIIRVGSLVCNTGSIIQGLSEFLRLQRPPKSAQVFRLNQESSSVFPQDAICDLRWS